MGVGARIREAREAAGLTQADLAFALRDYPTLSKIIPSRVSDWENDRVERLSFNAVDAIARVTGKPLEFFSELDAEPTGASSSRVEGTERDDDPRDDAQAAVAEAAGQRHPGKGAALPRRLKG